MAQPQYWTAPRIVVPATTTAATAHAAVAAGGSAVRSSRAVNEQQGIQMDNASATWPSEPRFSGDQRRPLLLTPQLLPLGSSLGGTLIPEPDGVTDDFDDELQQLLAGLDEIGNDGVTLRRLERTRSPPIVLKRAHKPVARHLHRRQHQRRQRQEEAEEQDDESDDEDGELSPTTLQIQRMLAELNGLGALPYNP